MSNFFKIQIVTLINKLHKILINKLPISVIATFKRQIVMDKNAYFEIL